MLSFELIERFSVVFSSLVDISLDHSCVETRQLVFEICKSIRLFILKTPKHGTNKNANKLLSKFSSLKEAKCSSQNF